MEVHLRVIRARPRAIIQLERDENMKRTTRDEILEALAAQSSLFERYGVSSVSLFGSVARGEPTEESDIDLLVEFSRPIGLLKFGELKRILEEVFGRSECSPFVHELSGPIHIRIRRRFSLAWKFEGRSGKQ